MATAILKPASSRLYKVLYWLSASLVIVLGIAWSMAISDKILSKSGTGENPDALYREIKN